MMISHQRRNRFFLWVSCVLLVVTSHQVTLSQIFTPITTGSPVSELGAWRSVNWVDYDRDGDLDLFVTRGKAGGQDNVLFRNDGPPTYTFTRMSSLVLSQDNEPSDGSSWGDYDNDGNLDCFVANWYNRNNLLYHNNGNGSFTRVLSGTVVTGGGYSETGSWGDYNNDGLIDLYVANSAGSRKNFLYKNLGNGQFDRILSGAVVNDAENSRGVNWVDYDEDGDLDLFVVNENSQDDALYKNMLVETGIDTFARVTGDPLVTNGGSSWSASWGDYDDDGDLDVFITNINAEHNTLFTNDGDGTFTKVTTGSLVTDISYSASAGWADIDNDGDLDIIVTNAYVGITFTNFFYKNLLRETGVATFQKITTGSIVTDLGYMYGLGWGDYDGDGDLDLFVARTFNENQTNTLYRNDGNLNHWLTLDCRGTLSNAAALGTKIRVKAIINGQPVWQYQVVDGQSGYCGQNLQVHFGLGDATGIDSLQIEWPSGNYETWNGLAVNQHLLVVEKDSTPIQQIEPTNQFVNNVPTIVLKWRRSLYFPPYRLQVSTDSTFLSGIILDTLLSPDTLFQMGIQQNLTRYYWRVKSARSIHANIWSEVLSWDNNVLPPQIPQRLTPSDNGANLSLTVSLRWMRASGAQQYHLRISTDSLFSTASVDTLIIDTSYVISGLEYLTTYYWIVQGENFVGSSLASNVWKFTTVIQQPDIPVLVSPSNGDLNLSTSILLTWLLSNRAASYSIQVSNDSLFSTLVFQDTSLTIPMASVQGLGSLQSYYWRVKAKNIGGSSAFSPFWKFTTVLASPVLLFPGDVSLQQTVLKLNWRSVPQATMYGMQLSIDSTFTFLDREDSVLADTLAPLANLQPYQTYYWRVRARHPQSISAWTVARRFTTTLVSYVYNATTRWNLISVPAIVPNLQSIALVPSALSPVFKFQNAGGAYAIVSTLEYGAGYWVKLTPSQTINILGAPRLIDTIDIEKGWNLIGSLSVPIAVTSIMSIPEGIVTSKFFGYNGAYQPTDSIKPMNAYWVKSAQVGTLILNASNNAMTSAQHINITSGADVPPAVPEEAAAAVTSVMPKIYALDQNYPNPFNPATVIRYQLPANSFVTVKVYNILGEEVATLVNGMEGPGIKSVEWSPHDIPSGIYVSKLTARQIDGGENSSFVEVRKMLLLK